MLNILFENSVTSGFLIGLKHLFTATEPLAQCLERPTGIWRVMGSTPVGGSVILLGGAYSLFTLYPSHQSIYQKDNGSIVSSCGKNAVIWPLVHLLELPQGTWVWRTQQKQQPLLNSEWANLVSYSLRSKRFSGTKSEERSFRRFARALHISPCSSLLPNRTETLATQAIFNNIGRGKRACGGGRGPNPS